MLTAVTARRARHLTRRWTRLLSDTTSLSDTSDSDTFSDTLDNLLHASDSLSEPVFASAILHGRGAFPAYHHPQTHGIPVASIHFRSYFPQHLDFFTHFASHAAAALAIPISRTIYLPTQRSLWTVPKGPFVHKKAQENFERKVHKRAIKAWDADPEVVDRWLKYLQRHILAGVGMRSTKWERVPVGYGEHALEDLMGQMKLEPVTHAEKVKALGDEIIELEVGTRTPENA